MYTETSSVEAVQTWLVSQLAKQLSINPQTIDVREPLTRYGLDSIDAVTFVGELEDLLGVELPDTLLWDYPSIDKAAEYLAKEYDISAALTEVKTEQPTTDNSSKAEKAPAGKGWGSLWGKISGS